MPRTAKNTRIFTANTLSVVKTHQFILLLFSGALTGCVFSFATPTWLLPLFIVPLIHYFRINDVNLRQSMVALACYFIPMYAVVLSWFLQTDVSGITGISTSTARVAALTSLTIMTVVLTICTLPLIFVIRSLRNPNLQLLTPTLLLLPAGWVVCEWLRSLGFSIFLYGNGGSIGDYWNFGSLGLAMMQTPLAHLSSYVGMYGLSFLVVLAAVLIESLTRKSNRKAAAIGLTTIILLGILPNLTSLWQTSDSTNTLRSASVLQIENQTPDFFGKTPIDNYQADKKNLIVLPEYSSVFIPGFSDFAETYINSRLKEDGFSVNVSEGREVISETWYGTLEFRDKSGNLIDTHTKELLIPTGEYMPGILATYYNLTNQDYVLDNYNHTRKVEKGEPPKVFKSQRLTIGPVACSGILGRTIYRNQTRDGAEVLTNSASLLLFNGSKSYFRQSLMTAKFHAVANARTYIQSTKGAPAFVIDANGEYIVEPVETSNKFVDFSFTTRSAKTIYTKLGEWMLYLSGLIVIIFLFHTIKRSSKKSHR